MTNAQADTREVAAYRDSTARRTRAGSRSPFSPPPSPRSYYEDDQWAPAVAGGRAFLREGLAGHAPDTAWAETRAGPVRIVDNGTTEKRAMSVDALLTVAQLLAS